uniref:Replication protein A C-terminal domain-containing protein n=1 Tax=Periophthalmus magnuspinnatus TaxID=409849 RepID=A0A3B3ZLR3_9GOBI
MWNQGGYADTTMAGGYTQSPGGFASPSLTQGGEKKGRTRATQIIPCTVSQLMSASQADESFKVGDVEVAQDPGVDSTVLPPGTYVKVSGNLRSFQNHRSVVAFSVRPLEDMNEITSHMLEVVHAHMALCKPHSITAMSRTNVGNMGTMGGIGGGYPGANNMANNGLSASQNQVLSLIRSCPDQQGISIQDIKQRLSGMSINIIKQAVEFLSNEGHIFSTIDEDHYKSTDNDE